MMQLAMAGLNTAKLDSAFVQSLSDHVILNNILISLVRYNSAGRLEGVNFSDVIPTTRFTTPSFRPSSFSVYIYRLPLRKDFYVFTAVTRSGSYEANSTGIFLASRHLTGALSRSSLSSPQQHKKEPTNLSMTSQWLLTRYAKMMCITAGSHC